MQESGFNPPAPILTNPVLSLHLSHRRQMPSSFQSLQASVTQLLYENKTSVLCVTPTGKFVLME
jgi:hypothetical protein